MSMCCDNRCAHGYIRDLAWMYSWCGVFPLTKVTRGACEWKGRMFRQVLAQVLIH